MIAAGMHPIIIKNVNRENGLLKMDLMSAQKTITTANRVPT